MSNNVSRYVRQEIFAGIGKEGQGKISKGRVAIIEMSSIGAAVANNLARAGVGYLTSKWQSSKGKRFSPKRKRKTKLRELSPRLSISEE